MGTGSSDVWRIRNEAGIDLSRPRIMAVINTTPDSFYANSRCGSAGSALAAAQRAVEAGADLIDLGGESTRPGADRVPSEEQVRRVVPVIDAIRAAMGPVSRIAISVDTTLSAVAEAAIGAGADVINDVSAGREDPRILRVAADAGVGLILMHRLRPPDRDCYSDRYTQPPVYGDVVADVGAFLQERLEAAVAAGIAPESVVLDPGLGFGKTVEQNLELIARTGELCGLGRPILSGVSRKSFVGAVSVPGRGSSPAERLAGTLGLSVAHLCAGARLFRVHDVADHVRALSAAWPVAERWKAPGHRVALREMAERSLQRRPNRAGILMASENVMEFTDANFQEQVLDSEQPVLVDFWAEWCMPCRMLTPTIEQIAGEFKGKAKVGKLNTDSNRDTAIKYQINAIPTIILFKGGEVERKFVGLTNKDDLSTALSDLAG